MSTVSTAAATGQQVRVAFAREQEICIPGSESLISYKPTLPTQIEMQRSENPSGQINPSGFMEPGIPGQVTPVADFGHLLTSGHMLYFLEHVFQSAVLESDIQTGIDRITFEGDSEGDPSDFYGFYGDKATRRYFGGYAMGGLEFESPGGAAPITCRHIDPAFLWETDLSAPTLQGTNGGLFSGGPWIQGRLNEPELGPLYMRIDTAGIAMSVKFHQTDGVPTFPGDAITLAYDAVTSRHTWQNAQGAVKIGGTVSVTAATDAVTGVGTRFTKYLAVGMLVEIEGEEHTVLTITDDTNLTLAANHTAGATGAELHKLNRDLGDIDENKEPVSFVFPGIASDHAAAFDEALTGTMSVTAGTDAVTGVGTAFTTELNEGDLLVLEGEEHVVLTITSPTALTLATNHVAGAAAASGTRIALQFQLTGTVSASGTALTGAGTDFVNELNDGDTIQFADGTYAVISSVTDATNAVLTASATQTAVVATRVVNRWLMQNPGNWTDPPQTFIQGVQRFTSAHMSFRVREVGETDWQTFRNLSTTWRVLWPGSTEEGDGSLFSTAWDRDGELRLEVEVTRNLRSRTFEQWAAQHKRFELEIRVEGQQLGDGSIREGLVFSTPNGVVIERESPASGPQRIEESLTIWGQTNDAGDSPAKVVAITPYQGFTVFVPAA